MMDRNHETTEKRRLWATTLMGVGALFILVGGLSAFGAARAEGPTFAITPRQATYLVGEPVVVRMTLTNTSSSKNLQLPKSLSVKTQATSFYIAPPKGEFEYYGLGYVREPSSGTVKLPPGGILREDQLLHFNYETGRLAFPTPGTYRIKATLHLFGLKEDRNLHAAEIQVQVKAPPKEETDALDIFRRTEVAFIVNPGAEDTKAVQALERLVRAHPRSRYALYARYFLARRAMQEYFKRKPDYRKAIKLLEGLAEVTPPFQMAEDALLLLARSHIALGERDPARAALEQLLQRFSETAAGDSASLILKGLKE